MEAYERRARGRAAVDLAVAAARLRNADDALVALGREYGDSYNGCPEESDLERAEGLFAAVAEAYAAMRVAQERYAVLGGPRPSAGG